MPTKSKESQNKSQALQPARIAIGMDIDAPDSASTTTEDSQSITVTTDIKDMNSLDHSYNLSLGDGEDMAPPTSSIDDLIMSSSTSSETSGSHTGHGEFIYCTYLEE